MEDEYGRELIKLCSGTRNLITYGIEQGDFHASELMVGHSGTQFRLITPEGDLPVWSPLLGRVNVYNLVAACAAAFARNAELKAVTEAVGEFTRVAGALRACGPWPAVYRHRGLCAYRRRVAQLDRGGQGFSRRARECRAGDHGFRVRWRP